MNRLGLQEAVIERKKKNRGKWRGQLLLWCVLFLAVPLLLQTIRERSKASFLKETVWEEPAFRQQKLLPELYEKICEASKRGYDFGTLLTTSMLNGAFAPAGLSFDSESYLQYKGELYMDLCSSYEAVWADLEYFPVPGDDISFEDTWLARRTYGGERYHEGTDLFGSVKEPGYYPIISMTDGVVEQIGWLPLGGYRIGLRTEHGGYFYYAHLSSYEKEFEIGEYVSAGDFLGYMGNTGYGEEGTKGQFPVHLHLGIYIQTATREELSVNPYWVLKAMEKNLRNYTY